MLKGGTRLLLGTQLQRILKIVKNAQKIKNRNKRNMANDMGLLEIHRLLRGSPGPEPMYRLNTPLICPSNKFKTILPSCIEIEELLWRRNMAVGVG